MIPVTKPFTPPITEYQNYLNEIWDRRWFTNNGPLVQQLEKELESYLGVKNMLFTSNGTIAIQIALKAYGISKKVITTPFSYIATTSSLIWEGCTPVFADIDPQTLNIDPKKIESLIDDNTEAILATHCFGNPCDIEEIEKISNVHNIKVIYDAAHCFGTKYKGKSIFEFGDISITSFHATKLFHTIEGGGIFAHGSKMIKKISQMRNFGHAGPGKFEELGINGKNSELHAAMGLVNLKYATEILDKRKELFDNYNSLLKDLDVERPKILKETTYNYSYYPIIFKNEHITSQMIADLEKSDIFPRRYFYPSLSKLSYIDKQDTPDSDRISAQILCLPLYHDLKFSQQELIANILLKTQDNLS